MTGEITLRGRVLPVGGIKEKILAAKRAGITDIMISEENRKDIEEINEKYVDGLTFHFVEDVQDVLRFALLKEKVEGAIDLNQALDEGNANEQSSLKDTKSDVAVRLLKEKEWNTNCNILTALHVPDWLRQTMDKFTRLYFGQHVSLVLASWTRNIRESWRFA